MDTHKKFGVNMQENELDLDKKLTRKEKIEMLREYAKSFNNLPPHAATSPLLLMDHLAFVYQVLDIFESED